jgi:hypothetical protein
MVKCEGKYKRTHEEGYEKFLAKVGLNMLMRKAATASTPTMEITQTSPGHWRMLTSTTLKKIELNFEFGKEFDETTTDGRQCKTTVTKESDTKWITNQRATKDNEKSVKVIRVFSDKGIDVEMHCEDVVSKQFFERVE